VSLAFPLSRGPAAAPVRAMVVDDSATIRGLLRRALEADPEIAVVAAAGDGSAALTALKATPADVVVLDIEMPVMDGLTALPLLLAARPGVQIIIASTLTRRNAEISLKALSLGATEYVTKPSASELVGAENFKRELVEKVKALGRRAQALPGRPAAAPAVVSPAPVPAKRPIALRSAPGARPAAIAIGSSTGGPQALAALLGGLREEPKQPIFITQHMPPTFTAILAEHLKRCSGRETAEAVDGEAVSEGRTYIAPGDHHMRIERTPDGILRIRLGKEPPEHFCRPAVDPMLRSLAAAYGGKVLAVILTGMGHDGAAGIREIVAAGGTVIAQDEASSVVWGMPGAAAATGLCSAVLPIADIGPAVSRIAATGRL
jgi:two-component system chemotaxis response regulator CheB